MITRRTFLRTAGASAVAGLGLSGYAFGYAPAIQLDVTRYRLAPPGWPTGLDLRAAVIADVHANEPWMSVSRIRRIVDRTNELEPDIVFLLGDYVSSMRFVTGRVPHAAWADALAPLTAPLGVHAVLGNHDWWDDPAAQAAGGGMPLAGRALAGVGLPVLQNRAVRLEKDGHAFWVVGLEDQLALLPHRRYGRSAWRGLDDMKAALGHVTDGAPVILLAHEPDIFPRVPERVALTLAGHTHGGQVRLFGRSPVTPSRYGDRYAYGHVIESGRHLLVSGGLGCSIAPVRFGVPPEIVLLELGGTSLRTDGGRWGPFASDDGSG